MLYVVTALYCEAKPFILLYSLKRDLTLKNYQLFSNDSIRLIITQTGKINAAIAVTELFHHTPPNPSDILINVGIAASCNDVLPYGSGYLIHKICDHDTNRDYYPDLCFRHSFSEASLATYSTIADSNTCQSESAGLIDMEASGIYAAAIHHLKTHQMIFYKLVSDHGDTLSLTPDKVTELIQSHLPKLYDYAMQISHLLSLDTLLEFSDEESSLITDLSNQLYFSVTMSHQFRQLLYYAKLMGVDLPHYLFQLTNKLTADPCHTKKEGKLYLERIRNELL